MTTEQIAERFNIVFAGRQYLCIPGADHPVKPAPPIERTVIDTAPRYAKVRRAKVIAALPGTVEQIIARTGVNHHSVHSVLVKLRKDGLLVQAAVSRFPVTYSYSLATVIG